MWRRSLALLVCLLMLVPSAFAQQNNGASTLLADNAATASNAPDLTPINLGVPQGFSSPATQQLWAPPGFSVSLMAAGLKQPRFMAFDAASNLLVADAGTGRIYRYPSLEPSASPPQPLLSGLNAPSNVALWGGYLYVGETTAISRYTYDPASGAVGQREVVVPNLPGDGHSTRTIAFGPDSLMYVAVGSSCNICTESDQRRAAILRFTPDGGKYERFAYGLRNPVALAFAPDSGLLWATVNERDNQGNEIPPDLLTVVQQGQNFGWPGCQPPFATPQTSGQDCSGITPPTIGIQAHSAPLGLAFSPSGSFGPEYAGDAFVAQHGSWNRDPPAAPKLLRVHFESGAPSVVRDFVTGWQDPSGQRWGRPAGVVVAPDGSLVVSDDQSGVLYRISRVS
jgi:glucose/arabinose dehydrogenase